MLSRGPIDELTFVNDQGRRHLWQLAQELAYGSVVLFAGAGLSFNANHRDGGRNRMPSWADLSKRLREHLDHDTRIDADPLEVADYFETKFGRAALVEAVCDAIQDGDHVPGRVHQAIARLNFEEIITTNFDTLIERSFTEQLIEPQVFVCDRDLVQKRRPPRILKMNGCIRLNPAKITITGDDFFSYAEAHRAMEVFVSNCFVESTVLFVGFGLYRAMNERVLSMLGRESPRLAFSLQHGISRTEREFWLRKQVQVIDLCSGEPSSMDHEERLYRVLDAFVKVQREHARNLWNRWRFPLLLGLGSEARSTAAVRDLLEILGAHLDEATRRRIADNQEERFRDLSLFLDDCVESVARRETREPKREEALGELAARLRQICRLEEAPGLQLSPSQWLPLRSLADLLLSGWRERAASLPRDLDASLRVLTALLSLKLFILAPRFAPDWGAGERERAASRLLQAIDFLDLEALGTQEMQIRSRLILLLVFLGPLHRVAQIAGLWTDGRSERELMGRGAQGRAETPEEYRLLPLSFEGALSLRHGLVKKAAESLWARQVFQDDPTGIWRTENAFRYRYLRQAAPDEEWTGVRLHTDRLAHVLGQLFFQTAPAGDREDPLLAVLLELNRGWLFGCPPPEALFLAWDAAEIAAQETEEVEALLLLSLPILGPTLFERWRRLLHEVWQRGHLDTCFLVDHAVQRLGGHGFQGRIVEHQAVEEAPVARYELGLAYLVQWLAERATFEVRDSSLARKLTADLLPELAVWLGATPYPEVRAALLRSLVSLRRLAPREVSRFGQQWALSQLGRSGRRSSLELTVLSPPPGTLSLERHQIQLLLAHAQSPAAAGTGFRNDLFKWLVSWAEHRESLDSLTLTSLASQITEILTEPGRSPGSGVEWLFLAAQVRGCSRLCALVEERLALQLTGARSPWLLGLVKKRLAEIPEASSKLLSAKGVLLASYIPFAEDFDEEMAELLEGSLRSPNLSSGARNDAVHLLAVLLAKAPEEIRALHAGRWQEALRSLLHTGAVGRGLLQEQIETLDPDSLRVLQANLIALLEREKEVRPREVVEQLAEKIRLGTAIPLADLEEELVRGIQSPHEALALHCLDAVIGLARDLPVFLDRNRRRIRRIRDLVEVMGNYRTPSRFAELLEALRVMMGAPAVL